MQEVWSTVQTWKTCFSKRQANDLTSIPSFFISPKYQTDAVHLICAVMLTDSSWTSGLPAAFLCGLAISACSNTNRTILHSSECTGVLHLLEEMRELRWNISATYFQFLYFKSNCSLVCDTNIPNKKAGITQMTKLLVFEPLPLFNEVPNDKHGWNGNTNLLLGFYYCYSSLVVALPFWKSVPFLAPSPQ